MSFFGSLSKFVAAPLVAAFVANRLPGSALGDAQLSPVLLTFLFCVSGEFAIAGATAPTIPSGPSRPCMPSTTAQRC